MLTTGTSNSHQVRPAGAKLRDAADFSLNLQAETSHHSIGVGRIEMCCESLKAGMFLPVLASTACGSRKENEAAIKTLTISLKRT